MSRHTGQGAPISLILAVVFPAMVGAALALAYYGYRYIEDVSRSLGSSFQEASRIEAAHAGEALETRIDSAARDLFTQIELDDDPAEQAAEACGVAPGPAVDSYIVFWGRSPKDSDLLCIGGRSLREWRTYRANFDLGSLQPGGFRYLHRQFDTRDVHAYALIAYMRKRTEAGRDYFIAARFRDGFIRDGLQRELGRIVENRKKVSVLDEAGRPIQGVPLQGKTSAADRFLFEAPVGKTLYAWRVQIAPDDVEALQSQAQRQRVFGPLLVVIATVIIAVGLIIVWAGVRAERRASRLKSDFIANVSHELKTPLSLIRMFGEMVATGRHKGEGAAREYGAIITRESERLSHLIDNVLDFARLERGKASYDFAEGDLRDVVERALDVCRYRLEKERMRLRTDFDDGLPLVRMDENAMTLVVLNLVDNAIKYAAEGGEVEVHLGRSPGGVVLSVRDWGPGIVPEDQRRIFERFYRARAARDRNVRGSGIGLALVEHIARAHGGRVTVESPVGAPGSGPAAAAGAAFRVYLPAPITEGSESALRRQGEVTWTPAPAAPQGPNA